MAFSDAEMKIILRAQDLASAQIAQVEKHLSALGRTASNISAQVQTLSGRLRGFLTGLAQGLGQAVFFSIERQLARIVNILPDLIGKGEEWGDTLDRIQDATGMTADEAFRLAAAAKFVGVSTDSLGTSLARFARNAIDNVDAFHRFGVEIAFTNEGYVDVGKTLDNVRRVMSDAGQSAEVTAGLMALLGRAGFEAADLLTLTDQQLRLITEDARRSGLAMTQAQIDMQQELGRTRNHLDSALTGLGTQIMLGVAPALTGLIEGIARTIQDNLDAIVQFAVKVVNFIAGLISGLFGVNIATISLAGSVGKLAPATRNLGGAMGELGERAKKGADGEDALTRSLNKQIDAIDRQLDAMDKRERKHDAERERQQLVGDIETMRQQLEDLKTQGVFTAGMSEAEAELARQKHASDIIDAQQAVNDAQDRLREHDRDEANRLRRDELEAERKHLSDRLAAHEKYLRKLAGLYKGPTFSTGPISLDDRATAPVSVDDRRSSPLGGLTAVITQAAEEARLAGQQMAADIKALIDKMSGLMVDLGALIGLIKAFFDDPMGTLFGNKDGKGLVPDLLDPTNSGVDTNAPGSLFLKNPFSKDIGTLTRSFNPGGATYRQLEDLTSTDREAADNTSGVMDRLDAGINTSVVNTPRVTSAPGFTTRVTSSSGKDWIPFTNPALSAMRFKDGKLSMTTTKGSSPGCFVAGTLVATPDGGRAIDSLRVGDAVLAFDESERRVVVSEINNTHYHPAHEESRYLVEFANGQSVTVTESHPFYSRGLWLPIGELKPGKSAFDPVSGKHVRIVSMTPLGNDPTDVFNLDVAVQHTFIVAGVLVHNAETKSFAQGGVFDTLGRMEMTVGEAGTEHVAVIRNPQKMSGGMGLGGPVHFHLMLEGREIAEYVTNWQQMNTGRSTTLRPGGR